MADDGDARPAHVFKILVTGPFAAGKTTLIRAVSQTPVVETDVDTTGVESTVKERTTVAMDFGTYTLQDGGIQLLMFGTPGQQRFWFMTEIMKGSVDAIIYVLDAEAEHTHGEAGAAMRELIKDLRVPLVVAVNRCDDRDVAETYARQLGSLVSEAALPCQLIDAASARNVVIEGLVAVLDGMEHGSVSLRTPFERMLELAAAA